MSWFCIKCCDCFLLTLIIFFCTIVITYPYPWHASCKVKWELPELPCSLVKTKLLQQIKEWQGEENCKIGTPDINEKCLYSLASDNTDTVVRAVHETPVKRYKDDLSFTFLQDDDDQGCLLDGYSTSRLWYAHLDYSTNFCNLFNLVEGAGLVEAPGFVETTSDKICTQYSSRNCTRF